MTEPRTIDERLAAILADEPDLWLVTDETEAVQVSVGIDGKIDTLRLAPSWWRRVSPEEVGSVVLRTRQASAVSRLHTISELQHQQGEALASGALPGEVPGDIESRDGTTRSLSQLSDRMHRVLAAFADVDRYRRAVTAATSEAATLTSPSGNATLELVGGSPRRLAIDPLNVQFTSEQALAAEIVELLRRADRWLAERRQTVLDELPALADVVRSVREPGR